VEERSAESGEMVSGRRR